MDKRSLSYAEAGVNVSEGNRAVELMKERVRATFRPEVLGDLGGFAGAFQLANVGKYSEPVLLASTDGVGTKLKVAFETGILHTVGTDLVAMCVNDILVAGAEPLFFLDYFATAQINADEVATVVGGIASACIEAGCALIGGETAEMPGFYSPGEFDLAGFTVGIADKSTLIDGTRILPGDIILGLPSSGLHSNGFSLVRHIISRCGLAFTDEAPWDASTTLGESLLTPTRIYVKAVLNLLRQLPPMTIKGMVNITGGGFLENIPRVLPEGCQAVIDAGSWPVHPVFSWLQENGNLSDEEMYRTFNNGVAFMLIVSKEDVPLVSNALDEMNEEYYLIGSIAEGSDQVSITGR